MKIEQFEDKGLSHYSYAILSESDRQVVLIDPSRDISQYLAYAKNNDATIIGVIETHPHADFVSGHLELHQTTGATIYCSSLVGAGYPHQTFDDGNLIHEIEWMGFRSNGRWIIEATDVEYNWRPFQEGILHTNRPSI